MGQSDKLTWQLTVLIYIYLPLVQYHSTDSLLIGKQGLNLSVMCTNHEYNVFVTLNASAIKKRHDVFKGNSGLNLPPPHDMHFIAKFPMFCTLSNIFIISFHITTNSFTLIMLSPCRELFSVNTNKNRKLLIRHIDFSHEKSIYICLNRVSDIVFVDICCHE